MSTIHKYDAYADLLLEILNPGAAGYISPMSKGWIQRHINSKATTLGEVPPSADSIIQYIRRTLGGEVLVYDRRSDLYVVASSPDIAHWYANKRRDLALSHAKSALKVVDDLMTRFPAYAPSTVPIHSTLLSVITMIEAHRSMVPDIVTTPVEDPSAAAAV